jgi:hypothetical protein
LTLALNGVHLESLVHLFTQKFLIDDAKLDEDPGWQPEIRESNTVVINGEEHRFDHPIYSWNVDELYAQVTMQECHTMESPVVEFTGHSAWPK